MKIIDVNKNKIILSSLIFKKEKIESDESIIYSAAAVCSKSGSLQSLIFSIYVSKWAKFKHLKFHILVVGTHLYLIYKDHADILFRLKFK